MPQNFYLISVHAIEILFLYMPCGFIFGGGASLAAARLRACGCRRGGRSWVGYLGSPYGGGLGLLGAGGVWATVSGDSEGTLPFPSRRVSTAAPGGHGWG
jgi:hypothetical protein